MGTNSTSRFPRRIIGPPLAGLVALTCVGCQSFSLSKEEFEKQQKGQMVDPSVGTAVGVVGTVGYLGAAIGAAVTGAGKK